MLRRVSVRLVAACPVVVLSLMLGSAGAEVIAVPNSSFENPDVSVAPYYTQLPNNYEPSTGDWGWSGANGVAAVAVCNNGYYTPVITNADGQQFCALDYNSVGFAASLSQDLNATYETGKSYTLTVGVANRGDIPGGATDQMEIRLFWRSLTEYGVLGTATVTKDELTATLLKDYTLTIPAIQSGDAAVGNTIGIWMVTTTLGASGFSSWSIDNVRLTAVPEPASLALCATTLIGLLAYAWHKRK